MWFEYQRTSPQRSVRGGWQNLLMRWTRRRLSSGRLGVSEMRQIEAFDLLARLEAARAEARSLQLSRLREIASPSGPEWTNPLWDSAQPKCCA